MGDWADLALDGVLCQHCGTYLGDACGYPRSCPGCDLEGQAAKDDAGSSFRVDEPLGEQEEDLPF